MKLLIAIPALDEEDGIEAIIERSLRARDHIVRTSPINDVEITVVSDGSTDRTNELARRYTDRINLVVFDHNRGYGAAIKEAWSRSRADVLGFIDADGTCDPEHFAELCSELEREQADVVLGCRINPNSRMPIVRRLGNALFAFLLSAVSSRRVRDAASGMRVVRRSSLPKLMPLPDGLHFTPAMSARAVLSDDLTISEVDMPYHERSGDSKLRIGKDGLRFLRVILRTALLYRPLRLFATLGVVSLAVAVGLMLGPFIHYVRYRNVSEVMIYRFIISDLAGVTAFLLLSAGYIAQRIVTLTLFSGADNRGLSRLLCRFFKARWFWAVPALLVVGGVSLVMYSFFERLSTGETFEHWSRFVAMSFLFAAALILSVTRALDSFLDLVGARLNYLRSLDAPSTEPSFQRVPHRLRKMASAATAATTTTTGSADTR
jgi:glycosyltransferase involved in cell wall biosynthesis